MILETKDLQGVFGMYEMEMAAAEITNHCRLLEKWYSFHCALFLNKDFRLLIGFTELLFNGWLDKKEPYYNGVFIPSQKFIDRVEAAIAAKNQE